MKVDLDLLNRRGGRVVEGARLESVFTGNRNEGSNPSLSATCFYSGNKSIIYLQLLLNFSSFAVMDLL